ncbi:MAG: hypothetical protein KatS3mg114_0590 [Planctomycetaceae bacterium]|nr:MAG: hypothetical protein KatS3mg114_0590 [Planctomycetaceae bacterium]
MGTRHWLAGVLCGALWVVCSPSLFAQAPTSSGYVGQAGVMPYIDPSSPQAAAWVPSYGPPPAWGEGSMAWPTISPYGGPIIDRSSYQNGLWFNEQNFNRRKFFVMMSGTFNRLADPDDTPIGNPQAPSQFDFIQGTGQGQQGTNVSRVRQIWSVRDWSDLEDKITSGGFQGMMGFFNPDQSGWMLHGFWAEEGHVTLNEGIPGIDINNPLDISRRAEDLLYAGNGGLPLLDGQLPNTLIPALPPATVDLEVPGGVQPYDLYYKLAYSSQAYGTGVTYYNNPWFRTEVIQLRPLLGVRYLNMRENAVFDAADSGLTYDVDPDTLLPDPGSITGTVNILRSFLRSNTKGHFGGPEIGLRLDLGRERFLIWLQSKFGLLAYHSTREIEGFGIIRAQQQLAAGTITTLPTPAQTAFHQQETTTSVAPLFEQTIQVRAPLLQFVPIINQISFFEEAQFQLGYTFTAIGAVYRPGNTIEWLGYPQFPRLTGEKSTWFMTSINIGVEWQY